MLTAPFLQPLLARPARYRHPVTPYETLGARLLRPKRAAGTLRYEADGQVPALPGQSSAALGWTASPLFGAARQSVGLCVEN